MNNITTTQEGTEGEGSEEQTEQRGTRCYASYNSGSKLSFDPMKDLNLPASYDEVLARFQRLQCDRAMEVLN